MNVLKKRALSWLLTLALLLGMVPAGLAPQAAAIEFGSHEVTFNANGSITIKFISSNPFDEVGQNALLFAPNVGTTDSGGATISDRYANWSINDESNFKSYADGMGLAGTYVTSSTPSESTDNSVSFTVNLPAAYDTIKQTLVDAGADESALSEKITYFAVLYNLSGGQSNLSTAEVDIRPEEEEELLPSTLELVDPNAELAGVGTDVDGYSALNATVALQVTGEVGKNTNIAVAAIEFVGNLPDDGSYGVELDGSTIATYNTTGFTDNDSVAIEPGTTGLSVAMSIGMTGEGTNELWATGAYLSGHIVITYYKNADDPTTVDYVYIPVDFTYEGNARVTANSYEVYIEYSETDTPADFATTVTLTLEEDGGLESNTVRVAAGGTGYATASLNPTTLDTTNDTSTLTITPTISTARNDPWEQTVTIGYIPYDSGEAFFDVIVRIKVNEAEEPPVEHSVSYKNQGVDTAIYTDTVEDGGDYTVLASVTPTAPTGNYYFAGWECSSDGEIYEADEEIINVTSDITLTAVWEPVTVSVTLKIDTHVDTTGTAVGGVELREGVASIPLSWNGTSAYVTSTSDPIDDGTYTVWVDGYQAPDVSVTVNGASQTVTINMYTVTLVAGTGVDTLNDGDWGNSISPGDTYTPVPCFIGDTVTLTASANTAGGYDANDVTWTVTGGSLSGNATDLSRTLTVEGTTTVTVTFGEAPTTGTAKVKLVVDKGETGEYGLTGKTVKLNSASGEQLSPTSTDGEYESRDLDLTDFAGSHAIYVDGYGVIPGVTVTVGGDTAEVQFWTVTAEEGTGAETGSATVNGGATAVVLSGATLGSLSLDAEPDDANGYTTPVSWTTDAAGDTPMVGTATVGAPITLYAHFTLKQYTVTYNANGGGGGPMTGHTVNHNGSVTLTANAFTAPTGHSYGNGWAITAGGTTVAHAEGATISNITENIALYAVWTPNEHQIFFNGNGADSGSTMANQTVAFGVGEPLNTNTHVRTGYGFAGWNTATDGSGTSYAQNATYTLAVDQDVTLFAQWTANPVTVTFHANGGTGTMGTQTFTAGTAQNLAANTFTAPAGYRFGGWNIVQHPNATTPGTSYGNGASATFYADTTLYAQWTANEITIGDGTATMTYGKSETAPISGLTITANGATATDGTIEGNASETINGVTLEWKDGAFKLSGKPQKVEAITFDNIHVTSSNGETTDTPGTLVVTVNKATPTLTLTATGTTPVVGAATSTAVEIATIVGPYYDTETNTWDDSHSIGKTGVTIGYTDSTLQSGTVTYTGTIKDGDYPSTPYNYNDIWGASSDTIDVTAETSHTVTVRVQLDGSDSTAKHDGADVTISGTSSTSGTTVRYTKALASGVVTFTGVPAGNDYAISINGGPSTSDFVVDGTNDEYIFKYWTYTLSEGDHGDRSTGGDFTADGIYFDGDDIKAQVVPHAGYRFAGWTGAADNNAGNPYEFDIGAKTELTANYAANTVTVTAKLDNSTNVVTGLSMVLKDNASAIGDITLADGDTNGTYVSSDPVPNGTYTVYVDNKSTNVTFTVANNDQTPTVNFYTVKYNPEVQEVHFDAGWSDKTAAGLYPVTADIPTTAVTGSANGKTVVITGTTVTFTAAIGSEDYTLSWNTADGDGGTAGLQVKYEAPVAEVEATLTQNTYAVSGTTDNTTYGGALGDVASVTFNALDDEGNVIGSENGNYNNTNGTFGLSLPGDFTYTFAGAIVSGKEDDTVIKEYTPADQTVNVAVGTEPVDGLVMTLEGAKYGFSVTDKDGDPGDAVNLSETWNVTYGYGTTDHAAKTVTITNTGNRPIMVKVVKSGTGAAAFDAVVATLNDTLYELENNGDYITFDADPLASQNAGSYAATYTVTAVRSSNTNTTVGTEEYKATLNVAKAKITAANVNVTDVAGSGVNEPVAGVTAAATLNVSTSTPNGTVKDNGYSWDKLTGTSTDEFAYGTEHTITVELVPINGNYEFDTDADKLLNFTIKGANNDADNVEVKVTAGVVTLKYTYPITDPKVTPTLTATSYDAATATAVVDKTGAATATVYYALILKDDLATIDISTITVDNIKDASGIDGTGDGKWQYATGTGTDHTANFGGLKSHEEYTLYAVAETTLNGTTTTSARADKTNVTFYKVTVKVKSDQTNVGNITAPTDTGGDDMETVGVKDVGTSTSLTITAATANTAWEFKQWTPALDGSATGDLGTVTTDTNLSAVWKPAAAADGPAPEIVITAEWKQKEFTLAGGAINATYATDYDSSTSSDTPFTLTTNGLSGFTYSIASTAGDDTNNYGFQIDGTGKITGKPTTTTAAYKTLKGDNTAVIKLTLTVTCTDNGLKKTAEITVNVGKLTVTPTGTAYGGDAAYQGETALSSDVSATVTAPHWNGTGWDDPYTIVGNWYFDEGRSDTDTTLDVEGNNDRNVYFDMTATGDEDLYEVEPSEVTIVAAPKSYKFMLVQKTDKESAPVGDFGSGPYLTGTTATVEFLIKNTGNQPLTFDLASFVLGNDTSSNFTGPEIAADPDEAEGEGANIKITVPPNATSETVFTMKVKNSADLEVTGNPYTDTLTVYAKDADGNLIGENPNELKDTLDLEYTVSRLKIPFADITELVAPTAGGTPTVSGDLEGTNNDQDRKDYFPYSIALSWAPTPVTSFASGETYTATVTLDANPNYYFAAHDPSAEVGNEGSYSLDDAGGNTVNVSWVSDDQVELTVTYAPTDVAPPTVDAWATEAKAGAATFTDAPEGTDVKYTYRPSDDTSVTVDAAYVMTYGTTYTGPDDAVLSGLDANTEYTVYAIAYKDGNYSKTMGTTTFLTPYRVTVTTDGNGTATVDGTTATKADPVTVDLYKDATDANANYGASGDTVEIAYEAVLTATPGDDTKYTFKAWTEGSSTKSTTANITYSPDTATTGEVTVTATFEAVYTIVFHENGGTGGELPESISGVKKGGPAVTLPAPDPVFTRDGYSSGLKWTLNDTGSGTQVTFGGTLTLSDDEIAKADANHVIIFYHAWTSKGLDITSQSLKAEYNMAQSQWTGAPTDSVEVINGSGDGNYTFTISDVAGAKDPTGFLTIGSTDGIIRLIPTADAAGGKRMGDAGTYHFNVTVYDAVKDESKTVKFELIVAPSTPVIVEEKIEYTYKDGGNHGYQGDPIVWDQTNALKGTLVRDPYDDALYLFDIDNSIDTGDWSSSPTNMTGTGSTDPASPVENPTEFTFKVKGSTVVGAYTVKETNYNPAKASEDIYAIERDPNIGVLHVTEADQYVASTTNDVTVTYGYTKTEAGGDPITVTIKNTGNTAFDNVTVTTSDSNVTPTPAWSSGDDLPADETTFTFTFEPPTGKEVKDSGYTVTFTVTGTTADGSPATATYIYKMTIEPKPLDHATLTGLLPPKITDPATSPDPDVAQADDPTYNALYTASGVTWTDPAGNVVSAFEPGVIYTASITLTPGDNHTFVEAASLGDNCEGYLLDGVVSTTGDGGADDDTNGGKVAHLVNEDGTVTITHTYDALPLGVAGVLDALDYDSAQVTSVTATTAVDAHLFYIVLDKEQAVYDNITPAMIKAAAVNGSLAGLGFDADTNLVRFGHDEAAVTSGTASLGSLPDGIDNLDPGEPYYLYVAAQPQSEYTQGSDYGLGKGKDDATLGKHLILEIKSTKAEGSVAWTTDTNGAIETADSPLTSTNGTAGPKDLTMTADDTFTPAPTNATQYGFSKWTVQVESEEDVTISATDKDNATENVYEYVKDNADPTTTLIATFYRKINGDFSISGDLAPGKLLGIALGGTVGAPQKLYVGSEEQNDTNELFGNVKLTYQWYCDNGTNGGTWTAVDDEGEDKGKGPTYTIPSPTENPDKHAGHKFRLVITYEDTANADPFTSWVAAETGIVKAQLETPKPDLQISENGQPGGASDAQKLTGGLYLTFPPIKQDDGTGNVVDHYEIKLTYKDADGKDVEVDNAITLYPSDMKDDEGNKYYEYYWEGVKEVTPGVSYTVHVQAIAEETSNYTDSGTGTDTVAAGKRTPTPADLELTVANKVFNGGEQTGATSAINGDTDKEAKFGTVSFMYAENAAGYAKDDAKIHVDLKDDPAADTDDVYHVFVNTTGGSWYLAVKDLLLTKDNYTGLLENGDVVKWKITQAPTTLTVANGKNPVTMKENDSIKLSPTVTYTSATVNSDQYETANTVTDYFDLTYDVTLNGQPAAAGTYTIGADTTFIPLTEGTFKVTVSATYDKDGKATTQFQADLKEPAPVEVTINVTNDPVYALTFVDNISSKPAAKDFASVGATGTYPASLTPNTVTVTLENVNDALTVEVSAVVTAVRLDGVTAATSFGYNVGSYAVETIPLTQGGQAGDSKDYILDLSDITYAGTYTLTFTAVGMDGGTEKTRATYTIQVTVGPKVIEDPKVTVGTPVEGQNFPTNVDVKDTTYGENTEDHTGHTIVWQEQTTGGWVTTTDTTPQPGKTYRPVITLKPDDANHVLDGTIDGETINGDPNGTNDAIITGGPGQYIYTGAPTRIPDTPVLMFKDEKFPGTPNTMGYLVTVERTLNITTNSTLSDYDITLGDFGEDIYDVGVYVVGSDTTLLTGYRTFVGDMVKNGTEGPYTLELSKLDTSKAGTYTLTIEAKGFPVKGGNKTVTAIYKLTVNISEPSPGGGGGGVEVCPYPVYYWIGFSGVTLDSTVETVKENKYPANVPAVTPLTGFTFLGWSLTNPKDLKEGETAKLVDPTTVKITKETIFYAVYEKVEAPYTEYSHKHYVIGYPNGTFGPADDITRGSVATIIARACLEGFVEGYDYGTGGYNDVAGHWAQSAIAFCTIHNVFKGYEDGSFRPNQPITRQELATVIARLAGMQSNVGMPFTDAGDIADWAENGVYTTYANGWVNGYPDGTFRPLDNIRRDETVKIFNGYLNRGVDADGLSDLVEYVHSGVASNNTEDGVKEYMTWPDVPKGQWAYYEIIEAGNDHAFYWLDEEEQTPPEHWTRVWINEAWLYHDDANDGGPNV